MNFTLNTIKRNVVDKDFLERKSTELSEIVETQTAKNPTKWKEREGSFTMRSVGILVVLALVLVGCHYDQEFDALTNFPSNFESKSIAELDLIVPEIEQEQLVESTSLEETNSVPEKPEFTIVQPGVKAFEFNTVYGNEKSKFVLINEPQTGLPPIPLSKFDKQDLYKLDSPFTATGLACADFDGDRLTDILIVNQRNGVQMYRNMGDCRFEDITRFLEPAIETMWGTSATIIDINNDGLLDFYLCGYDSPNRLYVNRGRKFVEQASQYGLDFRGASVSASFADYDRDGDLDMYLVTNRLSPDAPLKQLPVEREPGKPPRIEEKYRELNRFIPFHNGGYIPILSGQYDYLFQNNESRFKDVTNECLDKKPYRGMSALWCDFDNDGWPDIYVANDKKDPDQFLRNNGPDDAGKITFSDQTEKFKQTSWYATGVDTADLNQDGFFDLLVGGDSKSDQVRRVSSRGNLFGQKNDGWFLNWSPNGQTIGNCISLNDHGRHFGNLAKGLQIANTNKTWSIRSLDFDNDGQVDIFCGNGSFRKYLNNDLKREFELSISNKEIEAKGEFWQDEKSANESNFLFNGIGPFRFEDVSDLLDSGQPDLTQTAVIHDFDHDGDADILTAGNGQAVRLFRNDVTGGKSIVVKLIGKTSNSFGVGAVCKLIADPGGDAQYATLTSNRGFLSSEEPRLHFGVGDRDQIDELEIKWPSGVVQTLRQLKTKYYYEVEEPAGGRLVGRGIQMDLEKRLFIQEKRSAKKFEVEELAFDDFLDQPLIPFAHSTMGPGLAWGDVDGDQDYDLFVGGSSFEPGRLFENRNGNFRISKQDVFQADSKREDLGCVFFDADFDGDQDLYVVSGGVEDSGENAYQDRLYLNDGEGQFSVADEKSLPRNSISGMSVCAADFDQDNDIDLFVGGRILPG